MWVQGPAEALLSFKGPLKDISKLLYRPPPVAIELLKQYTNIAVSFYIL